MADNNVDPNKSWKIAAAVISGLLYFCMVALAIYVNVEADKDYAYSSSLVFGAMATIFAIVFVFSLPSEARGYARKQEIASYVVYHILVWAAILFLPFGNHPDISLFAAMAIILMLASQIVSLDEAKMKQETSRAMGGLSKNMKGVALIAIAIILALYLFDVSGSNGTIKNIFNNFVTSVKHNKKVKEITSDQTEEIKKGSNKMVARFDFHYAPFSFDGIPAGSNLPAKGTVNLSDFENPLVDIKIDLRDQGVINLSGDDITVTDNGDETYTIVGDWRYNNMLDEYEMLIHEGGAKVDLYSGGNLVATVNLYGE